MCSKILFYPKSYKKCVVSRPSVSKSCAYSRIGWRLQPYRGMSTLDVHAGTVTATHKIENCFIGITGKIGFKVSKYLYNRLGLSDNTNVFLFKTLIQMHRLATDRIFLFESMNLFYLSSHGFCSPPAGAPAVYTLPTH